jgi:hypothetical protein
MPADFLSRNAIDVAGIVSDHWNLEQKQHEFSQ